MAKEAMVTRTITVTDVTLLCMDVVSCEPCNNTVTLPRTYKDEKKLLRKAKEVLETDELKVVHIVDKKEVKSLYGMTETEFVKLAKVLPPRKESENK